MRLFPKLNEENTRLAFLGATLIVGAWLISPYLDTQMALAQGDHGRDLYAFERILHGERPYKDFWWVYGPLMPYYYALFFKLFGVNVMSAILGKLTLMLINSALFYLILVQFAVPSLAFLGSVYYLIQQNDFFFTYNHIGGLTLMLVLMLLAARYLKNSRPGYLYAGLVTIILLALVKLNFGVVSLLALTTTVWIKHQKDKTLKHRRRFALCALILTPLAIVLSYSWFTAGLTITEIRQCLPFLPGDQPHEFPVLPTIRLLLEHLKTITLTNPFNLFMSILTLLGIITLIRRWKDMSWAERTFVVLIAGLMILNLHEFLRSRIWYRLGWAQPQSYLLVFLMINILWSSLRPFIRKLILIGLASVCFFQGAAFMNKAYSLPLPDGTRFEIKTADHYLHHPRGKIYLAFNSPGWIETVLTGSDLMDRLVKPGETFFALPYDPLYYYLTSRKSPTRQLIFFDHIHISDEQESSIIAELDKNRTNWILLSSRMFSNEYSLGVLGETYAPKLADYIHRNFHVVYELGDWTQWPGWTDPHGIRVLKRDQPL